MPDPAEIEDGEDLVAVGADLAPGTLLAAYRSGLFPMPVDPYRRRSKIAWFSPDPRGVIPLDGLHVSRSLRRSRRRFEVRMDTAFAEVVRACGDPTRPGRWITDAIVDAYTELFDLGWAHSVEVYRDGALVGGLYGLRIERFFAGEAMFHTATDASKTALVALVEWLNDTGAELLDVQWVTDHLATLGAVAVARPEYLGRLRAAVTPRT
jgi:leucyl/phenylalanyl-tRNA---protein transferase